MRHGGEGNQKGSCPLPYPNLKCPYFLELTQKKHVGFNKKPKRHNRHQFRDKF